jgi:hypothetical protein
MEDTPVMERIRNYCADLEFPSVDAGYILNAFGYEMISEQVLIQQLKLWYESILKPEQSFQAAYSGGAPIYGFLCTWKDILRDVNRKRKRKPRVHKFAYSLPRTTDESGEIRAEALHNFRAYVERMAMNNLFPYHDWKGRKILDFSNIKMREEMEKEIEKKLPADSLYKWPLGFFSVS